MPLGRFTPQLRRFIDTPEVDCNAATLRAALDAAFARSPRLRGYVLDDQGRMLAALNLGHFGVKLHRSTDSGANW